MTKKQITESLKNARIWMKVLKKDPRIPSELAQNLEEDLDSYPTDEMIESMMKGVTVEN